MLQYLAKRLLGLIPTMLVLAEPDLGTAITILLMLAGVALFLIIEAWRGSLSRK